MKPGPDASPVAPAARQHRRVRLFVALHLGAVGAIYALAVAIGGGFAGPPMPALEVAMAARHADRPAPARHGEPTVATAAVSAPAPAWTQKAELAPPWESR